MNCTISKKGQSDINIATSALGAEVASALKVKYGNKETKSFDGFNTTSLNNIEVENRTEVFSKLHSRDFMRSFGYWTEPLFENDKVEYETLKHELNKGKYININKMTVSLPTKLLMYKLVNESNKQLMYLDKLGNVTSMPHVGREITPILQDENGITDVFNNDISNVLTYKVNDHKLNTQGLPVIIDNQVVTNNSTIQLGKTTKPVSAVSATINVLKNKAHVATVGKRLKAIFAKVNLTVNIQEDVNLKGISNVEPLEDGTFLITYNPNLYTNDSIYHEFAHIYIDLLKDSKFIQAGIDKLKGSDLWLKTTKLYPSYTGLQLGKEVLVTEIGNTLLNLETQSPLRFWVNNMINRFKSLFNIERNEALIIANQMFKGNLTKRIDYRIKMQKQWKVDENFASVMAVSNKFMSDKHKQLTRIIRKHKGNVEKTLYTADAIEHQKMLDRQLFLDESKRDYTDLEAITKLTEHDIKMLKTSEDYIDQLDAMFNGIGDLTKLSNDEVIENINQVQNVITDLNGFVHIQNLGHFDNKLIKELLNVVSEGITTKYEIKPDLTETAKELAEIVKELETVRKNMASRVNKLKVRADGLSKIAMASVIAQSSNPEIARSAVDILNGGLLDENWFQKYFMNNFDSVNQLVNTVEKVQRRIEKRKKHLEKQKIQKFKDVYGDATPEMIKSLTLNNEGKVTNKFVSKYDADLFFADINTASARLSDEGIQNAINEHLEKLYTHEDLEIEIANKLKELGKGDAFNRWVYDNITIDNGKYKAKLLGEFALPNNDKYLSKRYAEINENPESKEYKLLHYFLDELKDLTGHHTGLTQYYGGLPIIDTKKTVDRSNKEEFVMYDEFGNKIHKVRFRNIGDNIKDTQVFYPAYNVEIETSEEWEAKTLQYVANRYDLKFKSVSDIIDHNQDVKQGSKRLLESAISYDMGVVFPEFIKSSLEHKYKTEIENASLLTISTLEDAKFKYRDNANKEKRNLASKNPDGSLAAGLFNGSDSNTLAAFKKRTEMQLYGEFLKPNKTNKSLQQLRNYTALVGLGFNVQAAAKNVGMAGVQLRLEARAGIHYNKSDLNKARMDYFKNIASIRADKDKRLSSNKISALIKEFQVLDEYTEIIEQSHDLNLTREGTTQAAIKKKQALKKLNELAFGMTNIVEHNAHNQTLLAMMYSHRIFTDENGKKTIVSRHDYVNKFENSKDLNILKIKDKAYTKQFIEESAERKKKRAESFEKNTESFESMFDFKDGILTIKTDKNGKRLLDETSIHDFELKVQGVNHKLHGIYNREDKGAIENIMMGQMLMQFKHWLPAMWVERFGTTGNPFNTATHWNERRQEESIGNYNALWKMVGKSTSAHISQVRDLNGDVHPIEAIQAFLTGVLQFTMHAKVYYHTMNSYEQAALMKAVNEVMTGLAMTATIVVVSANVPDEKKDSVLYNFPMYVLKGLRQEVLGLTPVVGWTDQALMMTKSPFAAFDIIEDIVKLTLRTLALPVRGEDNYFKAGRNKGRLKAVDSAIKLFPGIVQADRFARFFEKDDNKTYSQFSF